MVSLTSEDWTMRFFFVEEMKVAVEVLTTVLFPLLSYLSEAVHDAEAYISSLFFSHACRHGSLLQLHGGM